MDAAKLAVYLFVQLHVVFFGHGFGCYDFFGSVKVGNPVFLALWALFLLALL